MTRSVSTRLLERVRKEAPFDLPADAVIRSLRPSRSQKCDGAWSWAVFSDYVPMIGVLSLGSQWTMLQCLRADVLTYSLETHGQIHVDAYPPLTPVSGDGSITS